MNSLVAEVDTSYKPRRKCIVCESKLGEFFIKGNPGTCYCRDCALEQFSSLDYLEKES